MIKHHVGHEGHSAVLLVLLPMRVCACYMSGFHKRFTQNLSDVLELSVKLNWEATAFFPPK